MTAAPLLFLQLACILAACRAVAWILTRARQPLVVAEMVAGFLMGPSFFGWVAPELHAWLFPRGSFPVLFVLSQLGLVLYMFCVGLEFQVALVRRHGRIALNVSAAGIVLPFVLGGALALLLVRSGDLFGDGASTMHAVLFTGAAMSITAFPLLARIISERGISGTTVGSLALSAGATNDAAAWVILAIVLSSFTGSVALVAAATVGGVAYGVALFFGLRPWLTRLAAGVERAEVMSPAALTTMLTLLALGACFTETVGMHAVFGAFLLGVATPRGLLADELRRTVEPISKALLVPLFFAYSGLNSQLALVNSAMLWATTALIFFVACFGKGFACWAAARWSGAGSRDALAVAALMNCRGMVELILLNIGLQYGLITPTLFTMLVLMAIGTTVMTGPVFSLIWDRRVEPAVDRRLAAERLP